jgi:hypothetical protein
MNSCAEAAHRQLGPTDCGLRSPKFDSTPFHFELKLQWLLQLRVLCFGLLEDWDVRVGIFPERKEVLIGRPCLTGFSAHGVCWDTKFWHLRRQATHPPTFVPEPFAMLPTALTGCNCQKCQTVALGQRLGRVFARQIRLARFVSDALEELLDPFGAERVLDEIDVRQPALKRARLRVYQSAQLRQWLLFLEHMAPGPEYSYRPDAIESLAGAQLSVLAGVT